MKLSIAAKLLFSLPMASAFLAPNNRARSILRVTKEDTTGSAVAEKPIFDPLNLYPESSEEKQQGRIQPLEPKLELHKKVVDPMGLYPKNSPEFMAALQEEQANVIANNERPIYDPMNLYAENTPERQKGLIQPMEPPFEIAKEVVDPLGLYPKDSDEFLESLEKERASVDAVNKQLYDPLRLYPESSVEKQDGMIKALEPKLNVVKPVTDPMNIYAPAQADELDSGVVMSTALPFMGRPALLDGELAGDAGFDPLGFAKSKEGLMWQREAELKHSRIAMLAAVGWPLSELFDKQLASFLHLKPLLVEGDRVPSLLNGGLQQVNPFYWMGILAVAGLFEALSIMNKDDSSIFDPLSLFPNDQEGQKRMEEAELKHGRLAMLAITAFAAIEALTHQAVVNGTPFFFHPPF